MQLETITETETTTWAVSEPQTESVAEERLLFPEKSNDELLTELSQSMQGNLAGFLSIFLCGLVSLALIVNRISGELMGMGILLGLVTLIGGIGGGLALSHWRLRKVKSLIAALEERQEHRALGLLLKMIQWVPQSEGSAARRAAFAAIPGFCSLMTPERFAELPSLQVGYIANLTGGGSQEIRLAILEMVERCGDARALRYLRDPGYRHIGLPDAEMKRRRSKCLAALGARIHEESRLAQLLRPSTAESYHAQAELLRPVNSAPDSTLASELLRPAPEADPQTN